LTTIPGCETDNTILVCKQDEDTVQVREQLLNDTLLIPIAKNVTVLAGKPNEIGLMQGFLTMPFIATDIPKIYLWGHFDDDNKNTTCGSPVKPNGVAVSYDGKYSNDGGGDPIHPAIGVGDGHNGHDYSVPIGTFIINASPNGNVWLLPEEKNGELRVHTLFSIDEEVYQNAYGHLLIQLVQLEPIFRGQILGISDHTGDSPYYQLHFDLIKSVKVGADMCNQSMDTYRSLISAPLPVDYSGSEFSFWSVDNLLTSSVNK
jgi:hypothetical protein